MIYIPSYDSQSTEYIVVIYHHQSSSNEFTMKSNSCSHSSNYCFLHFNTAFIIPVFNEEYLNGEKCCYSNNEISEVNYYRNARLMHFFVSEKFEFLKLYG